MECLQNEKHRLEHTSRFIDFILQISTIETSNNPEKKNSIKMSVYVDVVIAAIEKKLNAEETEENSPREKELYDVLKAIREDLKGRKSDLNSRSNWFSLIDERWAGVEDNRTEQGTDYSLNMAKEIISLCYNYTNQCSIDGISHSMNPTDSEFLNEFEYKLKIRCCAQEKKHRRMQDNGLGNHCETQNNGGSTDSIKLEKKYWREMETYAVYFDDLQMANGKKSDDHEIGKKRGGRGKSWKHMIFVKAGKASTVALFYIIIFCAIEFLFDQFEFGLTDYLHSWHVDPYLRSIACILVLGILSSATSHFINLPDIFTSIRNIVKHTWNYLRLCIGGMRIE